ncbi:MAG: hypothetical protein ACREFT_02165 [Acetobacteraceae bacterium]
MRRKRHKGEPHLVVERLDGGGRQLIPRRCTEGAGLPPGLPRPALIFTPGTLRALIGLVHTLAGTPSLPEGRHADQPPPEPAAPDLEHVPARDAPASDPALDRPTGPTASDPPMAAVGSSGPVS